MATLPRNSLNLEQVKMSIKHECECEWSSLLLLLLRLWMTGENGTERQRGREWGTETHTDKWNNLRANAFFRKDRAIFQNFTNCTHYDFSRRDPRSSTIEERCVPSSRRFRKRLHSRRFSDWRAPPSHAAEIVTTTKISFRIIRAYFSLPIVLAANTVQRFRATSTSKLLAFDPFISRKDKKDEARDDGVNGREWKGATVLKEKVRTCEQGERNFLKKKKETRRSKFF